MCFVDQLTGSQPAQLARGAGECVPTAVDKLRQRCAALSLAPMQFSSLHYVGTRTTKPPTDFSLLQRTVHSLLDDRSVRSPRCISAILHIMEVGCFSAITYCAACLLHTKSFCF